jgi:hypothetical protein
MIAHGKVSFHVCFKFRRRRLKFKTVQPLRRLIQPVHLSRPHASPLLRLWDGRCVSLLFKASGTRMPRLRNFDTEPHCPYCYGFRPDNRLESVANAHTAADLHVPPHFLNRAGLKIRGRRERFKRYIMPHFPQRK